MTTKAPWAILLCKFKSAPPGTVMINPNLDFKSVCQKFFTNPNAGFNAVKFFADMSHQKLDLSGSKVFGWYEVNASISNYNAAGDPVIDNNSAALDLVGRVQGGLHHVHLGLVRTAGRWLVDDLGIDVSPPVALPAGVPVVDITQTEYSFAFDASKLSSGIFALRVHNAGKLQHELVIKRVDANAVPCADALAIPVAGIQAIDPGSTSNVVLAEQLPLGHYFIFCEVSDGAGQTHLQHGMSSEFTVAPSQ